MTFFKRHSINHNNNLFHNNNMMNGMIVRKRDARKMLAPQLTVMEQATQRVHFDEQPPVVHPIHDHVRPEEDELVWYSMDYLHAIRREEIKNNLRAQYYSKTSVVEDSETLSWRGMEDILEQLSRHDKREAHVDAVMTKFRSQQHKKKHLTKHAQQTLRSFSRSLSKADRQRAHTLAQADAQFAWGGGSNKQRRSTSSSVSSARSWSSPRDFLPQNLLRAKLGIGTVSSWRPSGVVNMDSASLRTVNSEDDHHHAIQ
ncbi:expressed unknown protein [Seminavis robusta]|uniref:Uncharacterized protein n=1 Tax=Seminavis robusta TaxID=568900 RepID=A0A9N8DMC3_9STRA|nr:expressed unknown protein [Seminavis robusta]|eukprot:Sro205_g086240.1 n/a (257) ;mRNA; r:44046-44816